MVQQRTEEITRRTSGIAQEAARADHMHPIELVVLFPAPRPPSRAAHSRSRPPRSPSPLGLDRRSLLCG
ncbi:hypothetical protein AC230_11110 [Streptomyces caatingaensis]|uniref:Uncharacterized protein n=1 Tax=Streptomyces caatingaensis TaxID=1678637 RepID=A0A0K9XGE1_9ACTN|nr:hypothetical protein AC230_11110 [Streptomyces caatingaensis]